MSTRSTICVSDGTDSFCIYRHCDGYPDGPNGVVAELAKALPFAWPLPRFEAMDFAAAIIRAWKDGGGNIYLTQSHETHGDTDWQYNIAAVNGELIVEVIDPHQWDDDEPERVFRGSLHHALGQFAKEAA